jgi:hypothetical protein
MDIIQYRLVFAFFLLNIAYSYAHGFESKYIQYSFTIQNTTSQLLSNAKLWAYAPLKETSFQTCKHIEVDNTHEIISDTFGNRIIYIQLPRISPFGTKIITIKSGLIINKTPRTFNQNTNASFINAEKYIESDDKEMINFSRSFIGKTHLLTLQNIYEWVINHIQYIGYIKNDRGARWALKNKKGDCTEFMYLLVALCRANKIPSRCVGGYVCESNTIIHSSDYHNWAEVLYDGKWRIIDPQKKMFMENEHHYIAFKYITHMKKSNLPYFHRYHYLGNGLTVKMN